MKSSPIMIRLHRAAHAALHGLKFSALAICAAGLSMSAQATTPLADQPLFAAANVPGNLALVLSVEFPTAVSVAYVTRTYSSATTYLGYFDAAKCYTYLYTDGSTVNNYFQPYGGATNHTCHGQWSGNFLNWATMQTIDPFRWVLTGGYRLIDQAGLTVVEKAWASGQGGAANFPDSSVLVGTDIAGATPFSSSTSVMTIRIQGMGNLMRFTTASSGISFLGKYYNSQTPGGTPVLTRTDSTINFDWGTASTPGPGVNQANISAVWTGTITIPTTGKYTFRSRADDTVKLLVNGGLAFNQTAYTSLANIVSPAYSFTKGDQVQIEVDFSQGNGGSSVVLEWQTPGSTSFQVVGAVTTANVNGSTSVAYNGTATANNVVYDAFARVKVCDPSLGAALLEANCIAYGSNYKPEGLMQQYSNKMRYSALGYLNNSDVFRDGGVLRAQQKFIGPTQPVPGSTAVTNTPGATTGQTTGAEWDSTNGIFALNPDAADAANTAGIMGLASGAVVNSGVLNYVNKFGETSHTYKTLDNVSELYYAALRYFKNLPNVPEWTAVASGNDATPWVDGFPVITAPRDPILYTCQRNFILGIGDVHTHDDRNVPGNTISDTNEPTMPAAVVADKSVDAVLRTNQVGALELLPAGLGNIDGNYPTCCEGNSALIAGLAYDAHVLDIRGRATSATQPKPQTVDTYWVDVQEGQRYEQNNQFYLATKYGGFTVPSNYLISNTTPLPLSSWHTNTEA
jgi:type IV pilus assembly protein PilY1